MFHYSGQSVSFRSRLASQIPSSILVLQKQQTRWICTFLQSNVKFTPLHIMFNLVGTHHNVRRKSTKKLPHNFPPQTPSFAMLVCTGQNRPRILSKRWANVLKCLKWLPVVCGQSLKAWLHALVRMADKEQGNRQMFSQFLLSFEGRLRWDAGECFV